MLSWIAVGVILVLVVGAAVALRIRRMKSGPVDRHGPAAASGAAASEGLAPSDKEPRGRSASRWLSSLIKASGEDRAKRDGHRY